MIVLQKNYEIELYTTLKSVVKFHKEFSYYYLRGLKFPFEYKGYSFKKMKVK